MKLLDNSRRKSDIWYRNINGVLTIVPEEAEVVISIFSNYISGMGIVAIMKKLNAEEIPTRNGGACCKSSVAKGMRNEAYTGGLLLQKTFRENHLTKRTLVNNGELPMYRVDGSHEAIIDRETFDAVQTEMARRAEKHTHLGQTVHSYPFTGMLICGLCGKHYRRKVTASRPVWICPTFNALGKSSCPSKQISKETLYVSASDALSAEAFDADTFSNNITAVRVLPENTLVFVFRDGHESVKRWQDRSRSESWTQEMREAARIKTAERNAIK